MLSIVIEEEESKEKINNNFSHSEAQIGEN